MYFITIFHRSDWFYFCAASSTAVLVQLTPLLGALVGVVATLFMVAVCIVIFVKFRSKVRIIVSISDFFLFKKIILFRFFFFIVGIVFLFLTIPFLIRTH